MSSHTSDRSETGDPVVDFEGLMAASRNLVVRYKLLPEPHFSHVGPNDEAVNGQRPADFYADPFLGLKFVHPEDRYLVEALGRGELPSETRSAHPVDLKRRGREMG